MSAVRVSRGFLRNALARTRGAPSGIRFRCSSRAWQSVCRSRELEIAELQQKLQTAEAAVAEHEAHKATVRADYPPDVQPMLQDVAEKVAVVVERLQQYDKLASSNSNHMNADLVAQVQSLTDQVNQLTAENQCLKATREVRSAGMEELQQELEDARSLLESKAAEAQRADELQKRLDVQEREIAEYVERGAEYRDRLQAAADAEAQRADELQKRLDVQEREIREYREREAAAAAAVTPPDVETLKAALEAERTTSIQLRKACLQLRAKQETHSIELQKEQRKREELAKEHEKWVQQVRKFMTQGGDSPPSQ
eukprot:NODE_702_length_1248_cov_82.380910_g663_i0.p1 GENE.NODE_702_length_1248_cov_82.380910_g663_i0~~NODE_702_length_1248_cov_82.380910_g663_i0.p1  ORF type:complete len:312 (+),score=68.05 NODE_702_length_1248_cov_82.380910_g663_i0:83-1018(+)